MLRLVVATLVIGGCQASKSSQQVADHASVDNEVMRIITDWALENHDKQISKTITDQEIEKSAVDVLVPKLTASEQHKRSACKFLAISKASTPKVEFEDSAQPVGSFFGGLDVVAQKLACGIAKKRSGDPAPNTPPKTDLKLQRLDADSARILSAAEWKQHQVDLLEVSTDSTDTQKVWQDASALSTRIADEEIAFDKIRADIKTQRSVKNIDLETRQRQDAVLDKIWQEIDAKKQVLAKLTPKPLMSVIKMRELELKELVEHMDKESHMAGQQSKDPEHMKAWRDLSNKRIALEQKVQARKEYSVEQSMESSEYLKRQASEVVSNKLVTNIEEAKETIKRLKDQSLLSHENPAESTSVVSKLMSYFTSSSTSAAELAGELKVQCSDARQPAAGNLGKIGAFLLEERKTLELRQRTAAILGAPESEIGQRNREIDAIDRFEREVQKEDSSFCDPYMKVVTV